MGIVVLLNGTGEVKALCKKSYSQNCLLRVLDDFGNILIVQSQQVEDIGEALAVYASGGFELDLGLGAPGDTQACCVKHEKVIGSVTNRDRLREGNVVLSSD
jgi:hypothetical protein